MHPQQTPFAEAGFWAYYKQTRRERFLNEMEQVVPWAELKNTTQSRVRVAAAL